MTPTNAVSAAEVDPPPVWEAAFEGTRPRGAGIRVQLRREARFRRCLAGADVIGSIVALFVAVFAFRQGAVSLRPAVILVAPFIILASKIIGLYDRDQHVLRKTTIDELPHILYLAVLYSLSAWFCEALILNGWLARPQVFALALASFVFIAVARAVARALTISAVSRERCLVLGSAANAARIADKLKVARSTNAVVVGRVPVDDIDDDEAGGAPERLGEYRALAQIVVEHEIERVIIAPTTDGGEEILDAIRLIKALGVRVSVLARLLEVVGSSSCFDEVDGLWLLGVRHYGLGKSSEFLKRSMDVIGAGMSLLLLLPLLLMLAVVVKLSSSGPVFFSQSRIGRRGERFAMLKFRSMIVGADEQKETLRPLNDVQGGLFKITDDPRITRVGRFLRKTSLDELPQLLNVLRGDMSLVGPRPLVPDEDALIEGWQRRRLAVKPGMTGLWQVFGSSRIPMAEMVKIDYMYSANWSIWLDLKVLLKTIPYILGARGI